MKENSQNLESSFLIRAYTTNFIKYFLSSLIFSPSPETFFVGIWGDYLLLQMLQHFLHRAMLYKGSSHPLVLLHGLPGE
jgi:hypothetical protein